MKYINVIQNRITELFLNIYIIINSPNSIIKLAILENENKATF